MILAAPLTLHTLVSSGIARQYWEHNASHGANAPIVVLLHGSCGKGTGMERLTHFSSVADKNGAIVVYPQGIGECNRWNDGRPNTSTADDVTFISHVIDDVEKRDGGDPNRVIVGGMSNGAFMALRFACESDKAQTIVAVAGSLDDYKMADCKHHASNVLLVNGTSDPLVPYGGMRASVRGPIYGAQKTYDVLGKQRGCTTQPVAAFAKGTDGTSVSALKTYVCQQNLRVELLSVNNGGHTWPGGLPYLPQAVIGITSNAFDLSGYIMQFARGENT